MSNQSSISLVIKNINMWHSDFLRGMEAVRNVQCSQLYQIIIVHIMLYIVY